jgi:hypothetical protein
MNCVPVNVFAVNYTMSVCCYLINCIILWASNSMSASKLMTVNF